MKGEVRKQQLLDYLNKRGRSNVKQISEGIRVDRSTVRHHLKTLLDDKALVYSVQIDGNAATPYYTALVVTAPVEPVPYSGRTINRGSERKHPLKNQGGQGSLRRSVYVGSALA